MATAINATCPGCGTPESTKYVAAQILTFGDSNEEVPSHRYSVCTSCYKKQYRERYGEDRKEKTRAAVSYADFSGVHLGGQPKDVDLSFLDELEDEE